MDADFVFAFCKFFLRRFAAKIVNVGQIGRFRKACAKAAAGLNALYSIKIRFPRKIFHILNKKSKRK